MTEETLKVNDRLSVYLRTWEPAGRPRAAVALVHGLGEHSGLYGYVGEFLAGRLKGDVTLKTWEGYRHALHCEPEKDAVLAFIAGWMDKHPA